MRGCLLVLALSGCVNIPPFHGEQASADAATDAPMGPLAVRLIRNAYRDGGEDVDARGTPGMTRTGFSISSSGIVDGDLVLFIGSVDNGVQPFWNSPPGFTELIDRTFGPDGQSFVVGWKIAAQEPAVYTGTYVMGPTTSGAATISLLAVTGYNAIAPIEAFAPFDQGGLDYDPIDIGSPGITTTIDNSLVVYAAGGDWHGEGGVNTFTAPEGFTQLAAFGDRDTTWDWTSMTVASKVQAIASAATPIVASTAAVNANDATVHIPGSGWSTLIAIAPAPMP